MLQLWVSQIFTISACLQCSSCKLQPFIQLFLLMLLHTVEPFPHHHEAHPTLVWKGLFGECYSRDAAWNIESPCVISVEKLSVPVVQLKSHEKYPSVLSVWKGRCCEWWWVQLYSGGRIRKPHESHEGGHMEATSVPNISGSGAETTTKFFSVIFETKMQITGTKVFWTLLWQPIK